MAGLFVSVLPNKLVLLALLSLLTPPKEITIGYVTDVPGAPPKVSYITVKDPAEVRVLLGALEIVDFAFVDGSSAKPGGSPLRFVQFGSGRQLELGPDELAEIEAGDRTILVRLKPGFVKEVNRIASKHAGRPINVLGEQ